MKQFNSINWKTITTIEELKQLKSSWVELNKMVNNDCLFTSPEWLLVWLDTFWQTDWKLYVNAAFKDHDLILLAPFYIESLNGVNTLRFIGTGEPEIEEISTEYIDILCVRDYQLQAIEILSKEINNSSSYIQSIIFERVLDSSLVLKLAKALTSSFYSKKTNIGLRYFINLMDNSWENYLDKLPQKSFKSKLQRSLKRFSNLENAQYQILNESSEILSFYPKMVKLHQQNWTKKGKPGAFISNKFNSFHQQLIKNTAIHNKVKLLIIKVDKEVIAVFYFLLDKGGCYYYQSGIYNDFRPNISPGFLSHSLMIQYCLKHQIKFYDLMMGKPVNSYKSQFSPELDKMYSTLLVKKNLSGFFILLKWKLQKIKRWFFNQKPLQ